MTKNNLRTKKRQIEALHLPPSLRYLRRHPELVFFYAWFETLTDRDRQRLLSTAAVLRSMEVFAFSAEQATIMSQQPRRFVNQVIHRVRTYGLSIPRIGCNTKWRDSQRQLTLHFWFDVVATDGRVEGLVAAAIEPMELPRRRRRTTTSSSAQ